MKIAIITDHIPSKWAHSINVMKHAQAFFDLGHEVEILTIRRFVEDKNKLNIEDLHRYYDIDSKIKIKKYRDYSLNYPQEIRYLGGYLTLLANFLKKKFPKLNTYFDPEKKITDYCKKNNFELTYCRRTNNAAIYNIQNRIPTIFETHFKNIPPQFKRLFGLSRSHYFICVVIISKQLKQSFLNEEIPENRILIIDDAVDLNKFDSIMIDQTKIKKKLNLPLNKSILLYTGNLKEGRGIDTILNSTKYLDNSNLAYYFLGGNTKNIKSWKTFIKKKKILADIHFLGFKDNYLIPYYLKSANILLAPYSLKCRTVKWMSPIKLFEYMGSKIPIIASNVNRIKQICNNGECIFFKVDDPKDLSEKIHKLLNDENLQKQMITKAYKKAQKHTYIYRCKEMLKLFERKK